MLNTVRPADWVSGDPPKALDRLLAAFRRALNLTYVDRWEVTTTLTASATEIWRDTVPSSTAWTLDLDILGISVEATPNMGAYKRLVRVRRQGTAAPTIVQTDTIGTDYEDVAGWAITIAISSNDLVVSVTGDAARTVNWSAYPNLKERR